MSSEIAVKVERLAKRYCIYDKPRDRLLQILSRGKMRFGRDFWAVRDISFEIRKGETVGIVGRNGSGKSTLLQMICGTLAPTSGTVLTNGRVAALLELGAGFNAEFTGRENVVLNAAILGIPREDMALRMEEVLAFSELGSFLDQPVKTYSSGMYSRLAFSTAIHVDPDILIVDEALAVGDARFVAKCMRRIREIQEAGTTVLFVSHDVSSVRALCDSAIWLDNGRLVEHGDVFPVTGRFMEFMFKDDESVEPVALDGAGPRSEPARPAHADQAGVAGMVPDVVAPPAGASAVNDDPICHWGSHKGLILSAFIRDGGGSRNDLVPWGERFDVVIDLRVPMAISREHLSVAFSIKDLKGTDLIVSTTHDFDGHVLPNAEEFSVTFQLTNPLVTGKYLLVAAVENRQHGDIHYYEYLEGAHYFSSLSSQRLFGIFQPNIEQTVMVNR